MGVMVSREGGDRGNSGAEASTPATGGPAPIPDPFRAPDRAWHKTILAIFGASLLLSGLAVGWRAAIPFLFMLVGAAIELWLVEGPPRAAGKRVPGAILAARGRRGRALAAALSLAALGVIAAENLWWGRSRHGGLDPALLTFLGVAAATAVAVRLGAGRGAVRLTSSGLEQPAGPLRARKALAWQGVAEIAFERGAFVAAGKGVRIALDKRIDGLGDFAALALANAPAAAIDGQPGMRDRLIAMAAQLDRELVAGRGRGAAAIVR
jgi:hypothetical protein